MHVCISQCSKSGSTVGLDHIWHCWCAAWEQQHQPQHMQCSGMGGSELSCMEMSQICPALGRKAPCHPCSTVLCSSTQPGTSPCPPPRSSTQGWNQFGGFTLFSFYFFYIFNAVISQSALLKRFFFFSSLLKFSRIDSLFLMFHKSLF